MSDIAAIEAELKRMHGPLGAPDSMVIEYGAARRMALALENLDPIHYEEQAAKAAGYRGVVAPWPILWLVFFNCRDAPLKFSFGKATIHGEDSYVFHEPIIVGDLVTVTATISETSVKQGRAGVMGVIVTRREFHNQSGQLCAVMSTTNLRR